MTEERDRFCSPPEPGARPPRANRLSRSSRQTAGESPRGGGGPEPSRSEFKTPTRIPRPKPAAASSAESPHSDSDFQQDIVWDGASPSPRRPGRRTGKQPAGTVSISQIVSRIAPKHGRPRTSEPSLQQWIGDSAGIPCTPELPATRTRRKSQRTSSDVLLKLAQQFDQNLFHQGEELQNQFHQGEELQIQFHQGEELQNQFHQGEGLLSDRENVDPAVDSGTDPDQQLENDLDFLFNCSTQSLSPVPSAEPPPALTAAAVSTATPRSCSARDPFEDDWENDDLLNDTLVLEMTQNPHKFMTPQLCSTQNPPNQGSRAGPGPRAQKENTRPRFSFRLDRTSGFCDGRNQKGWRTEQSGSVVHQSGSVSARQMCRPISTVPEPLGFGPVVQKNPDPGSSQRTAPDVDLLDADLDLLFSSEPVWDDPADDDLLCGVCDELENQIQNHQRAVLQPAHQNRIRTAAAGPSHPCGGDVPTSPASKSTGRASASPWQQGNGRGAQSSGSTAGCSPMSLPAAVGGKCSAAEIELKKRRAVERRRQRLQAAQNLHPDLN